MLGRDRRRVPPGAVGVRVDVRRGVPPVRTVRPGDVPELWTEDAFGGRSGGPDDWVSRVIEFPFVNPQTGPFFVEGAEPGDTLAIHFVSIEPSRDWAASCTVPLFGALTSTSRTATLQEPLPEVVWIYEVDGAARTVTYRSSDGAHSTELPLDPMHGTVGVAPASLEAREIVARPRCARGEHGHPRDADGRDLLPGRERRGRAVLDRGRSLPSG
jgi:acetamidase/formamidase